MDRVRSNLRCLWLAVLIALGWLGCTNPGRAAPQGPQVSSKAWWIDSSGEASLAHVLAEARWTDYKEVKSFGFGPEAIWIRVRVRGEDQDPGSRWVVRVHPAFTDELTLYDPAQGLALRTGRAVPLNDLALSAIAFSFQIPAQAGERDLFLRVKSVSSRSLRIEVMPWVEAERINRLEEWVLGASVILSALCALWALTQWIATREPVMGSFALKQGVAALFSFFFLGFARISIGPLFPPGTLTQVGSALAPVMTASVAWFMAHLLAPYKPHRQLLRAIRVIATVYALLPIMVLYGMTREMLVITNATAPASLALVILTAVSALRSTTDQPVPLRWLIAYLLAFALLNTIQVLILLGVISSSSGVIIGTVTTNISDGMAMFFILQFRARELRRRQQTTELELLRSREQTEVEKRQREDQGRLFAMLAHEMKTPLATLRLWLGTGMQHRAQMDRTITEMNQIIERCVQTSQLADQRMDLEISPLDAWDLTQRCIEVCPDPAGVVLRCDTTSAPLQTDRQVASIVLANLLDNACKYRTAGTAVQVVLRSALRGGQAGWLWQIANQTGPTSLPDPKRLFQKYYRHPQARRQSGSGLGLYLVRGLLGLLQGQIDYEERSGEAVFSVWLPCGPIPVSNR